MRPVFCGNFEYDARDSDLKRLFRKYGKGLLSSIWKMKGMLKMPFRHFEFGRKGRRLRVEWTKNEHGDARRSGGVRRSLLSTRPSKTLFVTNFDVHGTKTKYLEWHFKPYGKIANVRIRRNFAFIQYESQEDATRVLNATNISKLMDKVILVEYAVKDDDVKGNGKSPERRRDRSPDRRKRSPSPYRREKGSPDYGRGSSPSAYRKEIGSPDYGRGRSPSPYKSSWASPDYGRKERDGCRASESPYKRDRVVSPESGGNERNCSPYRSPEKGDARNRGSYGRERESSPSNERSEGQSPDGRDRTSLENGQVESLAQCANMMVQKAPRVRGTAVGPVHLRWRNDIQEKVLGQLGSSNDLIQIPVM